MNPEMKLCHWLNVIYYIHGAYGDENSFGLPSKYRSDVQEVGIILDTSADCDILQGYLLEA